MILFSNNKTAHWLDSKSESEVKLLLKNAREKAPKFRQLYQARRKSIIQERTHLLQVKQQALELAHEKSLKEKEKLTTEILLYGLWQSASDIQEGIAKLKTKTAKLKAIKSQFQFRKRVLEQKYPDKDIFFMSKSGKALSIVELCANLKKLFTTQDSTCCELVGKRIRHKWCHEDGTEQWYHGKILSFVNAEWFNIKYDNEDEIVTLNIHEDSENGDLIVL